MAKKKPEPTKATPALPDWIDPAAWDGWLEMRRQKKAAPTQRALDLAILKLDELRRAGHDPNASLDQSTFENWTGLFVPRQGVQQTIRQRDNADRLARHLKMTGQQNGPAEPPPLPDNVIDMEAASVRRIAR